MDGLRVRIANCPITHLISWTDKIGGYTRCEIDFAWPFNGHQTNTKNTAVIVKDGCDCMACLVTAVPKTIPYHEIYP